jgi:hypothetical protein
MKDTNYIKEELVMKKLTLFILLLIAILPLFPDPLLAEKQKDTSVSVLNETYFVVVQSRGTDDSSVLLYKVYDGKLYLQDALVIDGEFADISRPVIRVLRPSQYSPRN